MVYVGGWLILASQASNTDAEGQFMRYISNLFDESCINVVSTDAEAKLIEHLPKSRQMANLNLNDANEEDRILFRNELKKGAFCAIAFLRSPGDGNVDQLKELLSVTKPIHTHAVVYFSQTLPDPSLLEVINRPLIWALTTLVSRTYILGGYLYCRYSN